MTFWGSLKESLLEMVFGRWQLESWRREDEQRKECERVAQRQYDELRKSYERN
jgi:hypothetical protein